jgi:lipopolysaccharide export system protein LptA
MKALLLPLLLLCSLRSLCAAAEQENFMMGSVVKSDKWKMDRARDQEVFDGNVSFRNPHYTLTADHALYRRKDQAWDVSGSVYTLRRLEDKSQVEAYCETAHYFEADEKALMERGKLPVRMKYTGQDGKILRSRSDKARAENKQGLMYFDDNFALSTENLDIYSRKGLYDNKERSFLIEESTPLAVGAREGYNFAINSERIKFFRDTRDIKFYNNVSGWVKDPPEKK